MSTDAPWVGTGVIAQLEDDGKKGRLAHINGIEGGRTLKYPRKVRIFDDSPFRPVADQALESGVMVEYRIEKNGDYRDLVHLALANGSAPEAAAAGAPRDAAPRTAGPGEWKVRIVAAAENEPPVAERVQALLNRMEAAGFDPQFVCGMGPLAVLVAARKGS